jgi:hypothetical protein
LLGAEEPYDKDAKLICWLLALVCVFDEVQNLGFSLFLDVFFELEEVVQLPVFDAL